MPIKAGLATLGFADVRYVDGEGLGITLACFTMLPYWVGIHFIALIHSRREIHTVLALAGLVASDVVCMLLKRLLRQDRPTSCPPPRIPPLASPPRALLARSAVGAHRIQPAAIDPGALGAAQGGGGIAQGFPTFVRPGAAFPPTREHRVR